MFTQNISDSNLKLTSIDAFGDATFSLLTVSQSGRAAKNVDVSCPSVPLCCSLVNTETKC